MRRTCWLVLALLLTIAGSTRRAAAETDYEAVAAAPMAAEVARATFATGIANREPSGVFTSLKNDVEQAFHFTELRGMAGRTITHRWEWNDQVMAEIPFEVKGQRWRVFSSKNLDPNWLGEWSVFVVDESGRILSTARFWYMRAEPDHAPASPEE